MHNASKEQREAVRQLVHTVIVSDMGNFNPERFKDWIKQMDAKFRKVAMTLSFTIRSRRVTFMIKELRTKRTAFQFAASTSVAFEDRDVITEPESLVSRF